MMNNFDQDELMLADLSTDYNADDIIDHINVNELIYSSCNNFAPWTDNDQHCLLCQSIIMCSLYQQLASQVHASHSSWNTLIL